ncbi:hypothetical protein RB195_015932 [Necator americanus]|uniref:Uncharacterized protein n=1 Tax=Necator americanus TaxID=51031 RepID=A0ABR1E702_NECAM
MSYADREKDPFFIFDSFVIETTTWKFYFLRDVAGISLLKHDSDLPLDFWLVFAWSEDRTLKRFMNV